MSVQQVVAMNEGRRTIAVEGYLVLLPGACTLMGCAALAPSPDKVPDCNTCELEIRLSESPTSLSWKTKTIRLRSERRNLYRCLSIPTPGGRAIVGDDGRSPCGVDAKGQHVLVRGGLEYFENDFERVLLKEPEICELPP